MKNMFPLESFHERRATSDELLKKY